MWSRVLTTGILALAMIAEAKKPNIVFVLTDDQDWHMQSLDYMPLLQKYLVNGGTLIDKHYCTVAVCCPSRVNLWTGKAAHTVGKTNVTDLFPPYGGYPKFVEVGLNDDWLPTQLQALGYNTYYTGKLFNHHTVDNYHSPYVKGFNGSDFLLDPYTYEYYRGFMTRNGGKPVIYEGQYSPDVVAEKAYGFLDEAAEHEEPFFLVAAPIAPHSDVRFLKPSVFGMAKYHERHAHLFKDYKIPRTADFNPDVPSGVGWVRELPQLNETVVEHNDEFQRSRLRALQSVDEMVEQLVLKLEAKGLLEDTYFFYSTDNGYHIGQHRMHPGKECPYETDIHIPLIVRGPGIPAGHVAGLVSSHTDLTPTFLKIAGSHRPDLDGTPIPLDEESFAEPRPGEHVNVEFWGRAIPEGKYGKIGNDSLPELGGASTLARNNTYKALRLIGEGYNLLYTVWCTGDREFYDLLNDPEEMHNHISTDGSTITSSDYKLFGRSFEHVVSRLDALLMVLKSCKGRTCHDPWNVLHPKSKVKTLKDALANDYDAFYNTQPKVSFASCQMGYLVAEEGPQHANVFGEAAGGYGLVSQDGEQEAFGYKDEEWSLWT